MNKKDRIVFMGTTDFSLKVLKNLLANNFNVVAVYTRMPKPAGRNYQLQKTVVHTFAEENGLPVYTPKSLRNEEALQEFTALSPDIAVVIAYGLIIPQNILDVPTHGFINIHASLLPRWRGASPVQAAIMAGDKQTGVTIMKMDAGIDTGDIISMQSVDILESTTADILFEQLSEIGKDMIVDTLNNLQTSLANAYAQPEEGATYAQKISKEECQIDLSQPAIDIQHKIMALSSSPAAWLDIAGTRVKILNASVVDNQAHPIGTIFKHNDSNLAIACAEGAIVISSLQPAGKKIMTGRDFLRGHQSVIGTRI